MSIRSAKRGRPRTTTSPETLIYPAALTALAKERGVSVATVAHDILLHWLREHAKARGELRELLLVRLTPKAYVRLCGEAKRRMEWSLDADECLTLGALPPYTERVVGLSQLMTEIVDCWLAEQASRRRGGAS